jgi:hypothetical protein
MASTAASRSIGPHPPLVCHMPLSTRHIGRESPRLLTVVTLAGAAAVVVSEATAGPPVQLAGLRRRGTGRVVAAAGERVRTVEGGMALIVRERARSWRRDKTLAAGFGGPPQK